MVFVGPLLEAAAEANARRVGALLERLEALQVPWLFVALARR